ncbi:MAG TPA: CYTH domain-containing protein [Gammaproteobacteria bacterium]|nr:CYTH domain-containing protein [Gammaproteobacteria bacterium]
MGREIERKFLVTGDGWRAEAEEWLDMRQGYLVLEGRSSVRVREAGERAWLNIKSAELGVERREFEYPIPAADAREMLAHLCRHPLVEKRRHRVPVGDHVWEVDEFFGDNAGLVVAEIELGHPDEPFRRPPWLGREVSHEARYYNVRLVRHPYRDWSVAERGAGDE